MIKGALHIHSNVSGDSSLSRQFLRDLFKNNGYNFIMLTEHAENLDCQRYETLKQEYEDLSDETFLMIPGLEIKWKERVHFLAYGARHYMPNQNDIALEEMIAAIRQKTDCDFLIWGHCNYPQKINATLFNIFSLVDGIEVFNIGYNGGIAPDFFSLLLVNRLRARRHPVKVFGGLDMHNATVYDKLPYIVDKLDAPKRQEIVSYLKNGDFICQGLFFRLKQPKLRYNNYILLFTGIMTFFEHLSRKVRRRVKQLGAILVSRPGCKA